MGKFWNGFEKQAVKKGDELVQGQAAPMPAEAAPETPQGPGAPAATPAPAAEPLLKWNELGGVEPRDPESAARAQAAALMTLPQSIEGANCANCRWVRILDEKMGKGFCTNPEVMQDVTPRMLCAMWEGEGTIRAGEIADQAVAETMGAQEAQAEEAAMAAPPTDPAMLDQAGAELGLDDDAAAAQAGNPAGGAEAPGGEEAPKKPKKSKDSEKKSDSKGSGNTINIHVGGKAEKKAGAEFWTGFLGSDQ